MALDEAVDDLVRARALPSNDVGRRHEHHAVGGLATARATSAAVELGVVGGYQRSQMSWWSERARSIAT
jgi:hypothetical protein